MGTIGLLTSIACICFGFISGWLISRWRSPDRQRHQSTYAELMRLQQERLQYEQRVRAHVERLVQLGNAFEAHYLDLKTYIDTAAHELGDPFPITSPHSVPGHSRDPHRIPSDPPRDYVVLEPTPHD